MRILNKLKSIKRRQIEQKMLKIENVSFGKNHNNLCNLILRKDCESIISVGDEFSIREGVTFNLNGGELRIGNRVFLNDGVKINCRDKIVIEEGTIIGQNVLVYAAVYNGLYLVPEAIICIVLAMIPQIRQLAKRLALQA